jgi:CRISPR-associated protein Cas1
MPVLHVVEQGARVASSQGALHIEQDGSLLLKAEPERMELLALYGGVGITSQAMSLCFSKGVNIALFAMRGQLKGICIPPRARNAALRLAQYARHGDAAKNLAVARSLVAAKLHNAACLLSDLAANHPEWNLLECRDQTLDLAARTLNMETADALRGLEGAGTAAYFEALRRAFPADAGFAGRRSRPATDPANALLSFAYTLLAGELTAYMEARGLDTGLGCYHGVRSGFAALAYDLVELFRHPFCDRLVLTCLNLKMIGPEDFARGGTDEDGQRCDSLRLKPEALKVFLAAYEKAILRGRATPAGAQTVRELFRAEVEAYVRDLRGTAVYQPLKWRAQP